MAKKKKDLNEENQENQDEFNDIDENFGLPEVELNPLEDSEEEEKMEEAVQEEGTSQEDEVQEEEPTAEEVVEEEQTESSEEYSWSNDETSDSGEESQAEESTYGYQEESSSSSKEYTTDESQDSEEGAYVPGSYAEPKKKNRTPGIVAVILIVILALGAGWYFGIYQPEQKAIAKAKQEKLAKQKAAKDKKEKYNGLIAKGDGEFADENWESAKSSYSEALALFSKEQYPKEQIETINAKLAEIAEANAKPKIGTIETISAATSRYYVVVSSSIDGDLAMDYSKKIIKDGTNIKLIEPYTAKKYYRVTVGDYDTWADAQSAISTLSTTFGNGLWILKY